MEGRGEKGNKDREVPRTRPVPVDLKEENSREMAVLETDT